MKNSLRVVCFSLLLALSVSSCQRAQICPAYQSTFIFDDSARYKLFSRFEPNMRDPKEKPTIERTWYGIVKEKPRRQKLKEMAIVEMRNQFPPDTFAVETNATDITPNNDQPLKRDGAIQH